MIVRLLFKHIVMNLLSKLVVLINISLTHMKEENFSIKTALHRILVLFGNQIMINLLKKSKINLLASI